MKIEVNDNNEIVAYVKHGDILDDNLIEIQENKIPDGFYENYKPSFYLLENNEIVENPDYVAPEPPVIGPSKQDKINAQIMLNQAKQKEDQDKFNAQILLKLAGGMK